MAGCWTADLDCSRSGNISMDLGVRLRFLAMPASLSAFANCGWGPPFGRALRRF